MPQPLPEVSSYRITDPQADPDIDELIEGWASNPAMCQLSVNKTQSIAFWQKLDRALFARRPDIILRAYGPSALDVGFLTEMPHLKRVEIATPYEESARHLEEIVALPQWEGLFLKVNSIKDLSLLERAPEGLTHLDIGSDWIPHRDLDSSVITRFKNLRYLSVGGCRTGLMAALSHLDNLRALRLTSGIQLKPAVMASLTSLEALELNALTKKDLSCLAELSKLRLLNLCGVKSVSDLSFIASLTDLQHLQLCWLNSLKVLPDISMLEHLESVDLDYLKKLEDSAGFARSPSLRNVYTEGMERCKPAAFEGLLSCPTVVRTCVAFQSKAANKQFKAMCSEHGVHYDLDYFFERPSSINLAVRPIRMADLAQDDD